MNLPVRISAGPSADPVISVDGAWDAKGLNLSHWPGNATPADLKHDLSTGIALNFARLGQATRKARAAGCVAICNNHYDTDGICSLYALVHPEAALEQEEALLAAARAGDFFQVPSEEAFIVDAIVAGLNDPARSPWREDFAGLADRERHELCTHRLLERLPRILAGDVEDLRELWEPPVAALRADLADLETATLDDLVHLSLCVWTAPAGAVSTRGGTSRFDPGRHALFGKRTSDRHLVIGPGPAAGTGDAAGNTYRFVVGTLSWFELVSPAPPPRPDLAALAAHLNGLEGTGPGDAAAWRHQSPEGASPELWFGSAEFSPSSEHASVVLTDSALEPHRVKGAVVDALRAAWVFPEDDEDDDSWQITAS